jgi:hypothetical protein
MLPTLRLRVIYERNGTLSMEMSFFAACPWPRPGSYGMNKDIKDEK